MRKISLLLTGGLFLASFVSLASAQVAEPEKSTFDKNRELIETMLSQPAEKLDFATIKLTIDKMIDPSIDIDKTMGLLDKMVEDIQGMISPNASSVEKMHVLRKYLYEKGEWNNHQIHLYDFEDPLGTKIANKMLSNYIASKRGNCISMPFLFIILGDKLGLNVRASTAPLHYLVKFTEDETNRTYNLETTSGANPSRDVWYQEKMMVTDEGIASGIYLQKLSRKETAATMVSVLGEHLTRQRKYLEAIGIFEIILKYYPKSVHAMLSTGTAYAKLSDRYFLKKYPNPNHIPVNQQKLFQYFSEGNRHFFEKAESLGWEEPPENCEEKYLQNVYQDAK